MKIPLQLKGMKKTEKREAIPDTVHHFLLTGNFYIFIFNRDVDTGEINLN